MDASSIVAKVVAPLIAKDPDYVARRFAQLAEILDSAGYTLSPDLGSLPPLSEPGARDLVALLRHHDADVRKGGAIAVWRFTRSNAALLAQVGAVGPLIVMLCVAEAPDAASAALSNISLTPEGAAVLFREIGAVRLVELWQTDPPCVRRCVAKVLWNTLDVQPRALAVLDAGGIAALAAALTDACASGDATLAGACAGIAGQFVRALNSVLPIVDAGIVPTLVSTLDWCPDPEATEVIVNALWEISARDGNVVAGPGVLPKLLSLVASHHVGTAVQAAGTIAVIAANRDRFIDLGEADVVHHCTLAFRNAETDVKDKLRLALDRLLHSEPLRERICAPAGPLPPFLAYFAYTSGEARKWAAVFARNLSQYEEGQEALVVMGGTRVLMEVLTDAGPGADQAGEALGSLSRMGAHAELIQGVTANIQRLAPDRPVEERIRVARALRGLVSTIVVTAEIEVLFKEMLSWLLLLMDMGTRDPTNAAGGVLVELCRRPELSFMGSPELVRSLVCRLRKGPPETQVSAGDVLRELCSAPGRGHLADDCGVFDALRHVLFRGSRFGKAPALAPDEAVAIKRASAVAGAALSSLASITSVPDDVFPLLAPCGIDFTQNSDERVRRYGCTMLSALSVLYAGRRELDAAGAGWVFVSVLANPTELKATRERAAFALVNLADDAKCKADAVDEETVAALNAAAKTSRKIESGVAAALRLIDRVEPWRGWRASASVHARLPPFKREEVVAVLSVVATRPDGTSRHPDVLLSCLPSEMVDLLLTFLMS